MAKLITAAERLTRARALIQKARSLPAPEPGNFDLSCVAQVKDFLQQARDLIKFISYRPGATAEQKAEVVRINEEIDQADKDLVRGGKS